MGHLIHYEKPREAAAYILRSLGLEEKAVQAWARDVITEGLEADDPHLGLIQFKVGTGGQAVEYLGEWDLPLNPLLYKAFDVYMKHRG